MQRRGQLSRFVLALRLRKGWKCEGGQEVVEVSSLFSDLITFPELPKAKLNLTLR